MLIRKTKSVTAALIGQGAIFDLDGVLVDTAEYHYLAWQQLADRIGIPFDRGRNEALRGIDRMNSLLLLLGGHAGRFSAVDKEAFCAEKNAAYIRFIERIMPDDILPGARGLLEALREAGVLTSVASSSKNARSVIGRLGILPLLNAVVDGSEVASAKPAPDIFLRAAAKLGVEPCNCVVVEDAEAGVAAAHAANMRVIGVGKVELVGAADQVVPNIAEVTPKHFLPIP